MEANIGLKLKGDYHVELIDSTTNMVKQSEDFHNIGCRNILRALAPTKITNDYSNSIPNINITEYLGLGSGTGTIAKTRDTLFSYLFAVTGIVKSTEYLDDYTVRVTKEYTFPATSSYVGNITELGFMNIISPISGLTYRYVNTHAFFEDSEGNPIVIEKTDTDILIVTATLEIGLESTDNFNIFPRCSLLKGLVGNISFYDNRPSAYYSMQNYRGQHRLLMFDEDINYRIGSETQNEFQSYGWGHQAIYTGLGFTGTMTDSTTAKLAYPKVRIPNTTITTETYYKGIGLQSLGAMMFPNENILPTYNITGFQIGIGDGETAQFQNPISYFKEGTEKIYINNVLVPSTDYTINHMGNINKLIAVSQNIKPVTSVSNIKVGDEIWGDCTYKISPMFRPNMCAKTTIDFFNTNINCFGINDENPAILDFGEDKTFNFIQGYNIRLIRKTKTGGAYSLITTSATIYIDSSDDGEEWNEIDSVNVTSNNINLDFESTTARYWRIRTSQIAEDSTYYYLVVVTPSNQNLNSETCGIALGNYDPYITFTTPPAVDDVITMDVGMDVIMKNDKFVLDITTSYIFSI